MKVLIADDDPMWRKLLGKRVQSWGHEVVLAEDGDRAWHILRAQSPPRIAILDWMMPGLDGTEICRQIRHKSSMPFIYTILVTGKDSREDMMAGMESGADDFFSKPMDAAILRSRLAVAERIIEAVPKKGKLPGFDLIERLGAGAMATVYKGKQVSLDRMVAVKVLPKKYTENSNFVERFYAEGRAAAKLNHPNIVAALDVGKSGDSHYFVMEYVEGQTVFEELVDRDHYPEDEALNLSLQIAKALQHAHEAGFIHRDVKPKNIIITPDRVAKLADMGLARAISDREAAEAEQGKAFGTPYYISPEQVRGIRDIDFRADIYGFGATLYHMVVGKVPFEGSNVTEVMNKHLKEELVPPDHIKTDLSSGMAEIIEVCLAKDPAARYASTAELIEDLESMLRGEAPLQARKGFELSTLSRLEHPDRSKEENIVEIPSEQSIATNPLFWVAVSGWAATIVLIIIMAMQAS